MGGCPSVDSVRESGPDGQSAARAQQPPARAVATQGGASANGSASVGRPATPDLGRRPPLPPSAGHGAAPSTPLLGLGLPPRRPLTILAPQTPDFSLPPGQQGLSSARVLARLQQPNPEVLLMDATAGTSVDRYMELERQRLSVPATPTGAAATVFRYFCPICMLHFKEIFKASCCSNYVCVVCALSHVKQRATAEAEASMQVSAWLTLPVAQPVPGVGCPLCNSDGVAFGRVAAEERPRNYQESPHTKDLFAAMEARSRALDLGAPIAALHLSHCNSQSQSGNGAATAAGTGTLTNKRSNKHVAHGREAMTQLGQRESAEGGGGVSFAAASGLSSPSSGDRHSNSFRSLRNHDVGALRREGAGEGEETPQLNAEAAEIEHDEDMPPLPPVASAVANAVAASNSAVAEPAASAASSSLASAGASAASQFGDADQPQFAPAISSSRPQSRDVAANSARPVLLAAASSASSSGGGGVAAESKRPDSAPASRAASAQRTSAAQRGEAGDAAAERATAAASSIAAPAAGAPGTGSISSRRVQTPSTAAAAQVLGPSLALDRRASSQGWAAESKEEAEQKDSVPAVAVSAVPLSSPSSSFSSAPAQFSDALPPSESEQQDALFLPSPQARQLRGQGALYAVESAAQPSPLEPAAAASSSDAHIKGHPHRTSSPSISLSVSAPLPAIAADSSHSPTAPAVGVAGTTAAAASDPSASLPVPPAFTPSAAGHSLLEESFSFDVSASFPDGHGVPHPAAVHPMPLAADASVAADADSSLPPTAQ